MFRVDLAHPDVTWLGSVLHSLSFVTILEIFFFKLQWEPSWILQWVLVVSSVYAVSDLPVF